MSMKRGKWAGFMQTVVSFAPVSRKGICKHQPIDWSLRDGNRGSDVYQSLVYVDANLVSRKIREGYWRHIFVFQ